jgi:hypothetical protein
MTSLEEWTREKIEERSLDMEARANYKRIAQQIAVGDMVLVRSAPRQGGTIRSQIASGPNGLLAKQGGPYKVIAKVGNAWKLQLPPGFRIHPVFAETELHKYKERVLEPESDSDSQSGTDEPGEVVQGERFNAAPPPLVPVTQPSKTKRLWDVMARLKHNRQLDELKRLRAAAADPSTYDLTAVCQALNRGFDIGQHDSRDWEQILQDVPARLRYAQGDVIELRPIVFDEITQYFKYTPRLDLFANSENAKCRRFYYAKMPGSFGLGAFAFSWSSRDAAYANPPWCLLDLTVDKIVHDQVRCLVVTPVWERRRFYQTLQRISLTPLMLSGRLYKRRGIVMGAPDWQSAAWLTDVEKILQYKRECGLAVPGGCKDLPRGNPLVETTRPHTADALLLAHHLQGEPKPEDDDWTD